MKTVENKQWMKMAVLTLAIGMTTVVNAQTAVGSDVAKNSAKTNVAANTAAIRVVDNKGTVKYLQANNGLTQIVNTTADVTTTTWQLGGTLTDDTYIDATGKVFALDGIALEVGSASTDATDASIHGTGTGYTLLVRDEATGAVKKLLMSDLVKAGQNLATIDGTTNLVTADFAYSGDATVPVDVNKVSVYRNGIKLVAGSDYTNAGTVGAVTVTVKHSNGVDPDDYAFGVGDKIEIQWIQ